MSVLILSHNSSILKQNCVLHAETDSGFPLLFFFSVLFLFPVCAVPVVSPSVLDRGFPKCECCVSDPSAGCLLFVIKQICSRRAQVSYIPCARLKCLSFAFILRRQVGLV